MTVSNLVTTIFHFRIEKNERTTSVWQYGGFSAKFNGSSSIEICAKLNICASISATSPSRVRWWQVYQNRPKINLQKKMNNLYNQTDFNGILKRLDNLQPNAVRQWGKMDVAQMLAHLNAFLETALNLNPQKRMIIGRILGRFFVRRYVSEKQFSKNGPTGKNYIFTDQQNFEKEKTKAIQLVRQFYENGPKKCTRLPHPFFGYLTPNEWAIAQWKHFDHHLRQFDA